MKTRTVRFFIDLPEDFHEESSWFPYATTAPGKLMGGFTRYSFTLDLPVTESIDLGKRSLEAEEEPISKPAPDMEGGIDKTANQGVEATAPQR